MSQKVTHALLTEALTFALTDLAILAGDVVGPSGVSWQDVAGTAAVNLRQLARLLDRARLGESESFLVFPSPTDVIDAVGL